MFYFISDCVLRKYYELEEHTENARNIYVLYIWKPKYVFKVILFNYHLLRPWIVLVSKTMISELNIWCGCWQGAF